MIWSVSMLAAASTSVRELRWVSGSIGLQELAWIGDAAAHRAGGRGERTCEQRACPGPLAALEIAVTGADGVLAARHEIAVHAQTHGAAGLAPLGAGGEEHLVQPLG